MRQRLVYMDFGDGFVNVSNLVKYETLNYTQRAFNDSYRYAQNECTFDLLYDPTIFEYLRYANTDYLVRIVDLLDNASITTEDDWFITTEDAFEICAETDIAVPVFYGHVPPRKSRKYNGILETTVMIIEATDELDLMNVPVGDIVLSDYSVCNPLNPSMSIVHYLCNLAGWNSSRVCTDVFIDTVISRFAPANPEATVLEVLSDVLYEYGYAANLDFAGNFCPVAWNLPVDYPYVTTFDDTNINIEMTVTDELKAYDSVKCVYYELGTASKVRLYTDDNCTFNDDGSFAGVAIYDNTYYPPEANVIDDTTGTNQVVEQEYTDDSIKYFTNKAVKENLDYSYKAFSSDFSAIVATENHFLDRRMDSGLTASVTTFGNKKCQLLIRNTSGSTKYLWYNNVYGDVWYKSSERTVIRDLIASPKKQYSYTTKYTFDKDVADYFVQGLSAQYEIGKIMYKFKSELNYTPGSVVRVNTDDGTDQKCIIRERVWDEYEQFYNYTVIACSTDKGTLTKRTSTVKVTVETASPYTITLSTGQINVPYSGSTPIYDASYVDITVTQNGTDVTEDWSFTASPVAVTGAFESGKPNRWKVSGTSAITGSVTITASKSRWANLSASCTVVRAIGEKGDPGEDGTGIALKGPVDYYTSLPTTGVSVGDMYIILNAGSGYDAGDGAVCSATSPLTWTNVGPIQGPAGTDGADGTDGTSSYLHVRYSAFADGTGFSTTVNTYIGTAVTTSPVAPTNKASYTWSKFIGTDGKNAVVMTSTTTPSGTYTGQLGYYGKRLYRWSGTAWVAQNTTAQYLGIGVLSALGTAAFRFWTVNSSGARTDSGTNKTPEIGDWMVNFGTTVAQGIYVWGGSTWTATTDSMYVDAAALDMAHLNTGTDPILISGFNTWVTAVIKNLFVQKLKILEDGALYGGTRFDSAGNEINTAATGFYLDGDTGNLKANLQSLSGANLITGTNAGRQIVVGTNTGIANVISGHYAMHTGNAQHSIVHGAYTCEYMGTISHSVAIGSLITPNLTYHTGTYIDHDVYIGYAAGYYVRQTENCVIIGDRAAPKLYYGMDAVIIGQDAAPQMIGATGDSTMETLGRYNTLIGKSAGVGLTTENYCLCLGAHTSVHASGGDDQINLNGRIRYFEFPSGTMHGTVYSVLSAYMNPTVGTSVGCMGRWAIHDIVRLHRITSTRIEFVHNGNASIFASTKDSEIPITSKIQIAFVAYSA